MNFFASLSLSTLLISLTANAHHGQDFLLLQDHPLPAAGSGLFTTNFEWEHGQNDDYGLTPSLMLGLLPRLALSLEANFRDEGKTDWDYASVTPAAHFQLSPTDSSFPLQFGLSAGYQIGETGAATPDHPHERPGSNASHEREHERHDHAEPESHDEASAHQHQRSVHAHGEDAFAGRFIVDAGFANTRAIFNLLSVVTKDDAAWGYAAGVRHKFTEQIALGIEALGDFDAHGWHEIDLGTYYEPIHSVTFKLGAGFGLTEETPDFILRTGVVYRF